MEAAQLRDFLSSRVENRFFYPVKDYCKRPRSREAKALLSTMVFDEEDIDEWHNIVSIFSSSLWSFYVRKFVVSLVQKRCHPLMQQRRTRRDFSVSRDDITLLESLEW